MVVDVGVDARERDDRAAPALGVDDVAPLEARDPATLGAAELLGLA